MVCTVYVRVEAINFVAGECKAGASVAEICAAGDKLITEKLSKVYKGKKVEKGIAFPTCVSPNNCCGHFSPLTEDSVNLKEGDVCKMCVLFPSLPFTECGPCVGWVGRLVWGGRVFPLTGLRAGSLM